MHSAKNLPIILSISHVTFTWIIKKLGSVWLAFRIPLVTPKYYYISSFPLQLPTPFALRFSRMPHFDFEGKPTAHTPFLPFPNLLLFASGRESKIYVCIPPGFIPTAFQYSRNIVTSRIVAPLPYFPHANAYMWDHRARTFRVILRDIARLIQWHAKSIDMLNMAFRLFFPFIFLSLVFFFFWQTVTCSLNVTSMLML